MSGCVICNNRGKARLSDKKKVCEECWFKTGLGISDPGYGSGFDVSSLDSTSFKKKYDEEERKRAYVDSVGEKWFSLFGRGLVGFSSKKKELLLKQAHRSNDNIYLCSIIPYEQIDALEITDQNVTRVSSEGSVGKAALGGLFFGVTGAVVGASMKRTDVTITNDQIFKLTIRNESEVSQISIPAIKEILDELGPVLEKKAESSGQETAHDEEGSRSVVDEILECKKLLDVGAITEEEFQVMKTRILER